jgi:hypothetical protein
MKEIELQQEISLLKQQQETFAELLLNLCNITKELTVIMGTKKEEMVKLCQPKIKK